jgi:preprotein translocase subunit SecG
MWIFSLIKILHIVTCFLLIVVILMQAGKGGGMGAAFGGATSSNVFGGRGATTVFQKITWVLATLFMTCSLTLAWHASKHDSSSLKKASKKPAVSDVLFKEKGKNATPPKEVPTDVPPPVKTTGDATAKPATPPEPAMGAEAGMDVEPDMGAEAGMGAEADMGVAPAMGAEPAMAPPAMGAEPAMAPPAMGAEPAMTPPPAMTATPDMQ